MIYHSHRMAQINEQDSLQREAATMDNKLIHELLTVD